jgi:hypothetical protein
MATSLPVVSGPAVPRGVDGSVRECHRTADTGVWMETEECGTAAPSGPIVKETPWHPT